jgi:macrolide-specific efflux system membrane fusion protein
MRWKLLAILALLVATGAVIAASLGVFHDGTAAATSFLTAAATTTDVTDEVTATGTVASTQTYDLAFGSDPVTTAASSSSSSSSSSNANNSSNSNAASSSGAGSVSWPVTAVDVKVGDRVTKGQTLAKAATTDLEAQIANASRAAAAAALQLKQAQDGLDGASGTQATRQAKIALYNAETAKANADANLADLKALRGLAVLTAPADGIVTAVSITPGADAPSGIAISIASAALEVTTSVVESDVAKISVGQKATVTISAIDATLQGTVATIAPTASTSSGANGVVSYAVEIGLDAPPASLRSGMSADVSIVTASAANVIAIPSRALSGTAGAYTVRVVADDGSVSTRSVEVGLITSSLAEIKSGLQVGERVVTGTSSTQNVINNARGIFGGGAGAGGVIVGR